MVDRRRYRRVYWTLKVVERHEYAPEVVYTYVGTRLTIMRKHGFDNEDWKEMLTEEGHVMGMIDGEATATVREVKTCQ